MKWAGWYDANPYTVHLDDTGTVTFHYRGRQIFSRHYKLKTQPDQAAAENAEDTIYLLGKQSIPDLGQASYPISWVNERGRGFLTGTENNFIACTLRGRISAPAQAVADLSNSPSEKHPLAGFWLSIAASEISEITVSGLSALTGYSYPTCHNWVERECVVGHIHERNGPRGRRRFFSLAPAALNEYWEKIKFQWPKWRKKTWPKRHHAGRPEYRRFDKRLPSLCPLQDRWRPTWSLGRGQIWATGADYLAYRGKLVQSRDYDFIGTRSSWEYTLKHFSSKDMSAPPDGVNWSATRMTVIEDEHPLVRILWLASGSPVPPAVTVGDAGMEFTHQQSFIQLNDHDHESREVHAEWGGLIHRRGLLEGLLLLDAINAPDARVSESGEALLARFLSDCIERIA